MKKFLLIATVLLLISIGICLGNHVKGFPLLIYSPVILLWDLPLIFLPLAELVILILSVYSVAKKDYERFSNVYKYSLLIVIYAIITLLIDNLFKNSTLFFLEEYIKLYLYILILIFTVIFIFLVEKKKDIRYYIVINIFVVIYLIYKFVNIV